MNTEALFLFLILLLGLVLCSFLGGNCNKESFIGSFNGNFTLNPQDKINEKKKNMNDKDSKTSSNYDNYNHYSGSSSQLTNGTIFYGENGGSIKVNMQTNGTPLLLVTLSKGDIPLVFLNEDYKKTNANKESFSNYTANSKNLEFYGPNGEKALVVIYRGQHAIKVTTNKGTYFYTINQPISSNQSISNPFNSNYSDYNNTPSTYYGSTGVKGANINNSNKAYNDLPSRSRSRSSSPSTSRSETSAMSFSSYDYSNSLPPGIPRNMIPPGKEDLYILKSEIVPPVCPVCPVSTACPRQEPCPPCPACARCPEPSFECKKVPNYNASANNEYLPIPVLNDFSSFGM